MVTQALYNKWRAQTFDDILGQEHITRTLKNQLKAGRVGHAYLFTGLRGTGKTSTARILAKAVNCVGGTDDPPCNRCPICRSITEGRSLDLIEIDAASNRGIDEIRALRDGVNFSPHESRYKVYVIDEVHMLTNEAFNALLKTLEEPPPHVIFILCTTEPHRLPDTILSRCQRFDFHRGSVSAVLGKLRLICEREGIAISPDALEMIARRGGGSFRDAESLLDQLAAYGSTEITTELVQGVLGSVPSVLVLQWVKSLVTGDVRAGLRLINEAIDNGAEPRQFLSEILDHLRALLLIRVGSYDNLYYLSEDALASLQELAATHPCPPALLTRAIRLFNEASQGLRAAPRPQLPLELAFIETLLHEGALPEPDLAPSRSTFAQAPVPTRVVAEPSGACPARTTEEVLPEAAADEKREPTAQTRQPVGGDVTLAEPAEVVAEKAPQMLVTRESVAGAPAVAEQAESSPAEQRELTLDWVQSRWNLILTKVKARNLQVRALLNSTYPIAVHQNRITLACEASFHRDMLSDERRLRLVEDVAAEVLELPCAVHFILDPERCRAAQSQPGTEEERSDDLFDRSSSSRDEDGVQPAADSSTVPSGHRPEEAPQNLRDQLLNHPAVKRLQQRGGKIVQVTITGHHGG